MAAKKETVSNKPIVSRVPLPVSDSALVIDLPDGQKLVIGKMSQGTVIEVATWRGVGRPDSRTNRMMFGMSTAEIEEEADNSASTSQAALAPENLLARIANYPMSIVKWLFNIQSVPKIKRNGQVRNKLLIEPTSSDSTSVTPGTELEQTGKKSRSQISPAEILASAKSVFNKIVRKRVKNMNAGGKWSQPKSAPAPTSDDLEIDTWLASITAKSAKNLSAPPSEDTPKKGSKK